MKRILGIAALTCAWPIAARHNIDAQVERLRGPDTAVEAGQQQPRLLVDPADPATGWSAVPSDGVGLEIRNGEGRNGTAVRLDVDFHGGGGYAVARKAIGVKLPANYEFSFWIRGDIPANNLEFKLIDGSGANVWWSNQRNFEFPATWRHVVLKKRHISFAWGPKGGGEMDSVANLEIAITAGGGGRGSVWIDGLSLRELPPAGPYTGRLSISTTSATTDVTFAVDGDTATVWQSADGPQRLTIDFGVERPIGGLVIDWAANRPALAYRIELSDDGGAWRTAYDVREGDGGRDFIYLPDTDTRFIRLALERSARGQGYGVREITVRPLEWSATRNAFFSAVAKAAPRGLWPRYLLDEASYWTVAGVSGDVGEALISTDGAVETRRGGFSIEPFIFDRGRLITWNDVTTDVGLARGYLPIPSVRWEADSLVLIVTPVAVGARDSAVLLVRYDIENLSSERRSPALFLAVRPMQVNPSYQFLNGEGGFSRIDRIARQGRAVLVNGSPALYALDEPSAFGAATFDQGGIADALGAGRLPGPTDVTDAFGAASGALAYALALPARGGARIDIVAPLDPGGVPVAAAFAAAPGDPGQRVSQHIADAVRQWSGTLDRVTIKLPPAGAHLVQSLRSNLAYVLINRDGPAIQPGSRAYSRSWIRDGALTSTAMLRLGQVEPVREFIDWFAPFQYASGKVPCCVDEHGAGPVPENDSHGELIYAIAEYYRYTKDRALVERNWSHVAAATAYMDSLRHLRMTPEYRTGEKRAYYGLLPESISHEGYSARPVHSYWDQFFALRGFEDAAFLAGVLGREADRARFTTMRDEFRRDLMASIDRAMAMHGIDYIPGSVELGDFDATSTTIALEPAEALPFLPHPALERTFEKYWENFVARRDGTLEWDAYTPYELRVVGTFVRLGWRERAHEALDFFFRGQRPRAWNQWPEVVWNDSTKPSFIGDLPHTWVGSDYIRATLDLFAYTRESDESIVLGAGIPEGWVTTPPGVTVRDMATPYGPLGFTMSGSAEEVTIAVDALTTMPTGGVLVRSPFDRPIRAATVDGRPVMLPSDASELRVTRLPARLVLRY